MLNLKKLSKYINTKDFKKLTLNKLDESLWPFLLNDIDKTAVLIVDSNLQIETLAKQIEYINQKINILKFPAWDCQAYDMTSPKLSIQAGRIKTITHLKSSQKNTIVITTIKALTHKTIDTKELAENITIKTDESYNRKELIGKLISQGFRKSEQVTQSLEFALRGDILDIYPNNVDNRAFRIVFFDDEVESIHTLNIESQRREDELNSVKIEQLNELLINEKTITSFAKNYTKAFPEGVSDKLYQDIKLSKLMPNRFHFLNLFYKSKLKSLFDYLNKDFVIFYANDLNERIEQAYHNIENNFNLRNDFLKAQEHDNSEDVYRTVPTEDLYLEQDTLNNLINNSQSVHFSPLIDDADSEQLETSIEKHIPYTKRALNKPSLNLACEDIQKWQSQGYKIIISCFSKVTLEHIKNALDEYDITKFVESKSLDFEKVFPKEVSLLTSPIEFGFIDDSDKTVLLTQQDIFGIKQQLKEKSKNSSKKIIQHLNQLKVDDFVVHNKHGIGKFIGIETITTSQTPTQDFAVLEYADNEKLFIPIISLDTLSLYSHAETGGGKLDKLGSQSFANRKEKVKKQLLELAQGLIDTASKRSLIQGYKFEQVDHLYNEFAEGFEYVLTQDQETCITDVLNDMYSSQPMDRLVIGDVGFGKTEIALRGCFVCVANIKQAAVIVPTTLLARQHYKNFEARFAKFGFKVAMLSRLNTTTENKKIKQQLKSGEVDIVIGTHSLLAKDIKFNDLGLLVVDEEQRFGVTHKEKLKEFKNTVDILTLSATPIPRTLHMSTSGIRDLSLITTPPVDRLPIKTTIMKYDSTTLKQALLKEIYRNGQAYIITPRVNGIFEIAEKVSQLVPNAKIKIAHGQMSRTELEETMIEFSAGDIDILIATTIVESGIDIENANTMIVFDSHRFGLAQLYQIRGRIGRGAHSSYAYFLLPSHHNITQQALVRLKILKKLDNIGAGFTLASYDMDLRGPGNILGSEQSGHIRQVGFSLYNKMLKETIEKLKNNPNSISESSMDESFSPVINVPWVFMLPKDYIKDTNQRLDMYRRLADIKNNDELTEITDEIIDRFGKLPEEVEKLIQIIEFKILAKELNIESIDVGTKGILMKFFKNEFKGSGDFIQTILARPMEFKLKPDHRIFYSCVNANEKQTIANIKHLLEFIGEFC
ncbi:MAG: transcription-repair coupling factor [Proteobacteria bacterium]|nr:transcription-repair coupling factor [Pseudomonadota bacterium]